MDYQDAAHHLHVKLARPPCAKRLIQKRPRLRRAGPSLGRMRPPWGRRATIVGPMFAMGAELPQHTWIRGGTPSRPHLEHFLRYL
jgi:hypothetical protein